MTEAKRDALVFEGHTINNKLSITSQKAICAVILSLNTNMAREIYFREFRVKCLNVQNGNYLWIHLERSREPTSLQYFSAASQINGTRNLRAVGLRWWHRLYWVSFLCKQSPSTKCQVAVRMKNSLYKPAENSGQIFIAVRRPVANLFLTTVVKWLRRKLAVEFETVPSVNMCRQRACICGNLMMMFPLKNKTADVLRERDCPSQGNCLRLCDDAKTVEIVQADNWREAAPNPDQVISIQHSSSRASNLCALHSCWADGTDLFCSICCCLTKFCKPTTSVTSTCGLCLYHPLWGLATSFAVISIWQVIYLLQNIFVFTRKE